MNNNLAIPSPKWRESNHFKMLNSAFSPKSRQSGEKKHIEITAQCEGIIEGVKESTVHIVSLKLTEKSIRASQIAEKLNKPYKTYIAKQIGAIEYVESKKLVDMVFRKTF